MEIKASSFKLRANAPKGQKRFPISDSGDMAHEIRVGPPPLPENYGKPLAPVSPTERIASLDVLRGFALLGILIANMLHFSQPLEEEGWRRGLWFGPLDRVADWVSLLLIEGKFYPLFSFLFGLGYAIQMDRASSRVLDPTSVYYRRLFILMGFGLAHGIFLWKGDVLFAYALCGFFLPLFRNRKSRTIAIWAAAIILLPALLSFMNGSYPDVVAYRLSDMVFTMFEVLISAPVFLGLFLLGLLAGRSRLIVEVADHRRTFEKILIVCGAVGLAGNFIGAWLMMAASADEHWGLMLIGIGIISIFGPVLTAAYIAGMVLLIDRRPSLPFLPPIAAVGRMALSNYLMQSLIATTIFYGYGLGLGGTVGRLGTIGIALLIFVAQILFSVLWLGFFRYGPVEWLWRSLTYGVRQPMMRERQLTPPP